MSRNTYTREQVAGIVESCIVNTLRLSGRAVPVVNRQLRPLVDIKGFDSPCGVDATVDIEIQLGGLDLSTNIFVKEVNGRPRARSFSEVVAAICRVLSIKGE